MAKKLDPNNCTVQLHRKAGVHRVRFVAYGAPKDTVDATITYDHTGTALATATPRDVTAGELAGTLQAFLDAIDAEIKTAEGIA